MICALSTTFLRPCKVSITELTKKVRTLCFWNLMLRVRFATLLL